jgi:menaquinone-dependent protoporphyrinogen oxidase
MRERDEMARRVLICFRSTEGQTEKVADFLARRMLATGCEVEVRDVAEVTERMLEDADAVVLGASIHMGRHQRRMVRFVQRHRDVLVRKPTAFFSISLTMSQPTEEHRRMAEQRVHDFERETGWTPGMFALFAGALPYTHYGVMLRLVLRRILRDAGGPTDVSRDHEFTDWEQVRRFADGFLRRLDTAGVREAVAAPHLEPALR